MQTISTELKYTKCIDVDIANCCAIDSLQRTQQHGKALVTPKALSSHWRI